MSNDVTESYCECLTFKVTIVLVNILGAHCTRHVQWVAGYDVICLQQEKIKNLPC